MPSVRVFVPTYRRPALLMRALDSLRQQTFACWVAEVHNDDPGDSRPLEIVAHLDDPRIEFRQHTRNLGAVGTFNLLYEPPREPFFAILEDDNWWEPGFLAALLDALHRHPRVMLAWCNQRIAEELPNREWRLTGELVNPPATGDAPRLIDFGDAPQALGALHANGAMVMRTAPGRGYPTPQDWPFGAVEHWRERMIEHPLLYLPEPLAVFARTRDTARRESRGEWAEAQILLAASFVKHGGRNAARRGAVWSLARATRPPATTPLLIAGLVEPACRHVLGAARLSDWLLLLRGLCRRPLLFLRLLRCRRRHPDWWSALDRHTGQRFAEARTAHV